MWARRTAAAWEGQGTKALGASLLERAGGKEGDLLVAVSGPDQATLSEGRKHDPSLKLRVTN